VAQQSRQDELDSRQNRFGQNVTLGTDKKTTLARIIWSYCHLFSTDMVLPIVFVFNLGEQLLQPLSNSQLTENTNVHSALDQKLIDTSMENTLVPRRSILFSDGDFEKKWLLVLFTSIHVCQNLSHVFEPLLLLCCCSFIGLHK
jgi:hypothetical protein